MHLKYIVKNKDAFKEKIISILAILYSVYVIYEVGIGYLGLAFIMYAVGTVVYIKAKKEKNESITGREKVYMAIMILFALIMINCSK